MQVAAYQQGINLQIIQQAGDVLQPFLFQQTTVVQIRDKSQPATVECGRNITVCKLILPDALHILISGCRKSGYPDRILTGKRRGKITRRPAR